jgi:predicted dehydrogenase
MARRVAGPARPVGWGVLGATSQVAQRAVLPALVASPGARLVAVASRRWPAGGGRTFGASRVYDAYEGVLEDPAVEAVYVPLPNALHREWVERAAAAGKHVLCEKPLATTADEARAMTAACARAGVLLAEAYMTPFHPRTRALDTLVRSGRLGPLRFARAAFTGVLSRADDHRWRPETGGGALLDVGVYCVAPLLAAAGRPPVGVEATAVLAPSGVDASFAAWLDFGDGLVASIEGSFDAPERQLLELVGTQAAATLERAHTPGPGDGTLALRRRDGRVETVATGGDDPYRGMVDHVSAAIRGETGLARTPEDAALTLGVLDRVRRAAGLAPVEPAEACRP